MARTMMCAQRKTKGPRQPTARMSTGGKGPKKSTARMSTGGKGPKKSTARMSTGGKGPKKSTARMSTGGKFSERQLAVKAAKKSGKIALREISKCQKSMELLTSNLQQLEAALSTLK